MLAESTSDLFMSASGGKPWTGAIAFPEPVRRELRARRLAGLRGQRQESELNSHAPVVRAKLAVLLAMLDGRVDVTEVDWQLSAVLWDTSCAIRDELIAYGQEEAERRSEARDDDAVRRAQRVTLAQASAPADAERVAKRLQSYLDEQTTEPRGRLRKRLPSRDRGLFPAAVEYGVGIGWLAVSDDGQRIGPGPSKPVRS